MVKIAERVYRLKGFGDKLPMIYAILVEKIKLKPLLLGFKYNFVIFIR